MFWGAQVESALFSREEVAIGSNRSLAKHHRLRDPKRRDALEIALALAKAMRDRYKPCMSLVTSA